MEFFAAYHEKCKLFVFQALQEVTSKNCGVVSADYSLYDGTGCFPPPRWYQRTHLLRVGEIH